MAKTKNPFPDLTPDVQTVRAVVTTRWNKNAYRPLSISSIESYYVDTALDNDADTWTFDMGDPDGTYLPLLKRDNEVRVQLYGVGRKLAFIMTGIADDVEYEEVDGIWTVTGRDLSMLATDSTPLPHKWNKARAWSIVKSQAHDVGFHDTQLSHTGIVKKTQYTDGSESYWDFWYRLYRQEKMFLWTTPTGILVGSKLNYKKDPIYFLGDQRNDDPDNIKARVIPVIQATLTKTTQNRIEEVVVYGQRGQSGFNVTVKDPTLKNWKKKARKVMLDAQARNVNSARKTGWEEIFEGKVGSVELKITIPDPGFPIQQNQIARLYLKEIDLYGRYFVVGTRLQGGPDGFVQEVRLREIEFAVSNRVPTAPKLDSGTPGGITSSLGKAIEGLAEMPSGWGDYFVKAANKYHGVINFQLFLACLLGICQQETGFQNEREHGGPGGDAPHWYPFQPSNQKPLPGPPPGVVPAPVPTPTYSSPNDKRKWEQLFANEPGVFGITRQFGVGPMQLTSLGLKQSADDLLNPGHRDQYAGGRWHPEHNIMIAARDLANCVQGTHAARDQDVWLAVDAYNRGISGAIAFFDANGTVSPYAQAVRKYVNTDPGFLSKITSAMQSTKDAQAVSKDGWTSAANDSDVSSNGTGFDGFPSTNQVVQFLNGFNRSIASPADRRKAIWYTALWGAYHSNQMNYLQQRPMKDMAPPPNVPGNLDCSQFATWCYESAGAPDPNGLGYNGSGNTETMFPRGQAIPFAALKPGDLVFYSSPRHVGVYVGQGIIAEMGSDPGPLLVKVNYRSDIRGYRTYVT